MKFASGPIARAESLLLAVLSVACFFPIGCTNIFGPATVTKTGPPPPVSSAKFAYVANNGSSTLSMYTVSSTGKWTPTSPATVVTDNNPSVIVADPQGKFVYVANTYNSSFIVGNPGKATVDMYAIDQSTGILTPLSPASIQCGADPQDLTLSPSGKFAYTANTSDATISVFSVNQTTGQLTAAATVTALPPSSSTISLPVAVTVHPSGKFLYLTNIGYVQTYAIDASTGGLTLLPGEAGVGSRPFKVAFDPAGQFAYVPDNDTSNIWAFSVDITTGALTPLSFDPITAGKEPAWVAIDPASKFAYASNRFSDTISAFSFSATTGAFTPLPSSSPSDTGGAPWPILFDPSGQILYVLNENSDSVISYAINSDGSLTDLATTGTGFTPWSFALIPNQ